MTETHQALLRQVSSRGLQLIRTFKTVIILAAALLAGCGMLPKGTFTNRAACTPDRQEAIFCSFYGPLCVGAKIDERDAGAMCNQFAAPAAK